MTYGTGLFNPRLGGDKTLEEFRIIMESLKLPYPKKIDIALPANRECGKCDDASVRRIQELGGKSTQGWPVD